MAYTDYFDMMPRYSMPSGRTVRELGELKSSTCPERAINKLKVLYDNGEKYHTKRLSRGKPTNAEKVPSSGSLEYTVDGMFGIKTTHKVPMKDIAAIVITYSNGDILLRKLKPCAKLSANVGVA